MFLCLFLCCVLLLFIKVMLRCCAFSASFVGECTGFSHVAGVKLTVHMESVVVEEIKEVQLRSRRAQFIYERNYNRSEEFDEK